MGGGNRGKLLWLIGSLTPPPDQEKKGGYDRSPTSPSASIVNDDRHSQMIRDLQQQILEQNKLHKQFLEEARKCL